MTKEEKAAYSRAWYAKNRDKQHDYRKKYYAANKDAYLQRAVDRQSTLEGFLKCKIYMAKSRARKKDIVCDLTVEQLMFIWNEQSGKCALTGVEMTMQLGEGWKPTNGSIDRIDSAQPYTKGNVRFLCDMVNRMKSVASDDELKI
ncbi:MAG: hypothetical protein MN733_36580, partial [Nitrososphaera sp.]|nr:hypothetical protein [Nitrososphaera sp.]